MHDDVRRLLQAERERARRRLVDLTGHFDDIVASADGANLDDEHDPEGATIAFERSQVDALVRQARERLVEVDAALGRLDRDEYGVCEVCGGAIPAERLGARPTARTCVGCA